MERDINVKYAGDLVVIEMLWGGDGDDECRHYRFARKDVLDKLITDLTEARDKAFRPFPEMDG